MAAAVGVTQKTPRSSSTSSSSASSMWTAKNSAPARRHSVPALPLSFTQPPESASSPRHYHGSRKNSLTTINEKTPRVGTSPSASTSTPRFDQQQQPAQRCRRRSVAVMSHLYTSNEKPRSRRISSVGSPSSPPLPPQPGVDQIIDEYVREMDEIVLKGGLGNNPESNVAVSSEFTAVMNQMSLED